MNLIDQFLNNILLLDTEAVDIFKTLPKINAAWRLIFFVRETEEGIFNDAFTCVDQHRLNSFFSH